MAAAGNDGTEKTKFPISGAFSSSGGWLDACSQALQEKQLVKLQSMLNGYRVTAWRICVEKRRKQIADMIGANIELKQLPPDCRNRILEFLPDDGTDPNVRGGAVAAFEVDRKLQRRREELAEKWAKKLTDAFLQGILFDPTAQGDEAGNKFFMEKFIQEPVATGLRPNGEVSWLGGNMMRWWKCPVLKTKIEALGYVWEEIDNPGPGDAEFGSAVVGLSIRRRAGGEVDV